MWERQSRGSVLQGVRSQGQSHTCPRLRHGPPTARRAGSFSSGQLPPCRWRERHGTSPPPRNTTEPLASAGRAVLATGKILPSETCNLFVNTTRRSPEQSYLSCWRQLLRFLRGSLLTAGGGRSSSSKSEAGTGQSGIFTGVTGLEELASPFGSFLCF